MSKASCTPVVGLSGEVSGQPEKQPNLSSRLNSNDRGRISLSSLTARSELLRKAPYPSGGTAGVGMLRASAVLPEPQAAL